MKPTVPMRNISRFAEKVEDATQELVKFTGDKTTEQTLTRYQKRRETIATRKAKIIDDIHDLSGKIDVAAERLRQRAQELEGEHSRQSFIKSEMERSKYVLGRLESTVFEQEIWNALLPLKEQYHVHTLDVEKLDEKHQRETRILYKSDLLFYLKSTRHFMWRQNCLNTICSASMRDKIFIKLIMISYINYIQKPGLISLAIPCRCCIRHVE